MAAVLNYAGLENLKKMFANIGEVSVREHVETSEYKLRFFFAGWHTAETFYCEDDNEAIFDAENSEMKAANKLPYALFCGNRLVKKMNYTGNPYEVINE